MKQICAAIQQQDAVPVQKINLFKVTQSYSLQL